MLNPHEARAKFPKVFGILSIIFGGLGAMSIPNNVQSLTSGQVEAMGASDTLAALWLAAVIFLGVSAIALVGIGIGQLRYRRWARIATLVWSVSALAFLVIAEIVVFAVVVPSTSESAGAWFMVGAQTFFAVTLSVYPILLLAYFRGARARLWMTT